MFTAALFAAWALAMCVVGVALGLRPVVSTLWTAWQTRHWIPVEVTVIEQAMPDPDDPPLPLATYRYSVDGRSYVADRIGVAPLAYDGFDHWHADWTQRLQRAQQDGFTLPGWADPRAPHRAVLDRQLRIKPLLWRGVIALVLLSLAGMAYRALGPAWRGDDWTRQRGVWGFAGLWIGITAPMAGFWFLQEPGLPGLAFALVFWGGAFVLILGSRHGRVHAG
ncbi:DUF3592 domain-containing protein [Ideonella sp. 4Y16]|uniref:DUF3592 domain-containing protein n=1 Tax=Ideonella alba TaxID=2824118 RepID=UPI001B3628D4|nr:DUF3592 domain-containing protein [Ideonella alba]MBQ0942054.1 DUF3592 domain-containing protein [Ideonella alba]